MPRDISSMGWSMTLSIQPEAREDGPHLSPGLGTVHAVQARAVEQVLHRRQLLEEAGLHRYAVDQPPDGHRLPNHVVTEHRDLPAVGDEQGRDQPDERRLPTAVGAEHAEDLSPLYGEADVVDGDRSRRSTGPVRALQERQATAACTKGLECGLDIQSDRIVHGYSSPGGSHLKTSRPWVSSHGLVARPSSRCADQTKRPWESTPTAFETIELVYNRR
jgi:hypothetical protein